MESCHAPHKSVAAFYIVMSIYDSLNDMQREAVYATEGPLLILAGAGSGKTRVLTHRIAYLIEEKKINPWNILAVTFTNKAAAEMRERIDKLVGFGSDSIWVATFHSTCVRILRRYIDFLGYDNKFSIYDTDDQKTIVRHIIKDMNLDPKMYRERPVLSQISSAKNEMIMPDEFLKQASASDDYRQTQIGKIYKVYERELKKNNAVDFDDLLIKTVELFENSPEILNNYQERFKYILVDEYQDTNTVQFRLISLLARKYKNLCVVGDDDQSIYKFRGANIQNILDFENVFSDTKVIKLEQNYRSTQNILNAANEVIKNNIHRKSKKLWTKSQEGELVKFRQFGDAYEEAEAVIDDIVKKVVNEKKFSYSECAILYRTNAQSRAFEEKCIAKSVPYRLIGGINFYQRQEIKDILAYLKTIDNGKDDLSVRRILNVPKRGIGATTEQKVQMFADEHGISFFDALKNCDQIPALGKAAEKIKRFVNEIIVFRTKLQYDSLSDVIESVMEDTGYLEDLLNLEEDKAIQKRENLDEFLSKAVDFEKDKEKVTLSEFLEEVALVADIDSLDSLSDRIVLMTLHGAKGLEFPNVYLVGMEDGLFPSRISIYSDDPTDIEEERRLCYVGITRAMKNLTLTAAKLRTVHGEQQLNMISRFVKEIPDYLIDYKKAGIRRIDSGKFKSESSDKFSKKRTVSSVDSDSMFEFENVFGVSYQNRKGFSSKSNSYAAKDFTDNKKVPFGKSFMVNKSSTLSYSVGDTVRHTKFGTGVVKEIVDGKKDFEVTVDFDTVGQKKMFAGFAKLEKM